MNDKYDKHEVSLEKIKNGAGKSIRVVCGVVLEKNDWYA